MSGWPANPVATMRVRSYSGGTSSTIQVHSPTAQQVVMDANLEFRVEIEFHDHPWIDNGRGYFSAQLEKLTAGGWVQMDFQAKTLGNDDDDGDWYDTLVVKTTMTDFAEIYQIQLRCETRNTSNGTGVSSTAHLQAVQGSAAIGDFTLDFVPMSIVYCPPGQDMTASLTQSSSYGTRFTIGQSSGMHTETGVETKVDVLGLMGAGVGFTQSQSTSNESTSGIQVSHFRSTIVTADNQKAIGRAYWGPLGDIFVILVNPNFAASRRADGTILYSLRRIEQVLLIPAWKLLRPQGDPIASSVPADVRRRLLELDPFIHNLDLFFPDGNADLAKAANPYADPSAHNRAELIGRWWLDTGTELNYAMGESKQLFTADASEVKFSSTVTINASVGINYDGIAAGLGMTQSNTTWVGFQSSKETEAAESSTASCFLMHNQNERDLDGIDLYYDKIYSTLMFRRVRARRRLPDLACVGAIHGTVVDAKGVPFKRLGIELIDAAGQVHATTSTMSGEFGFANLCPGNYTLATGDIKNKVVIKDEHSPLTPLRFEAKGVKRVIDVKTAPVWEVREALGLSSDDVRKIRPKLRDVTDVKALAKLAGADGARVKLWSERNVFTWSKPAKPIQQTPKSTKATKPAKRK